MASRTVAVRCNRDSYRIVLRLAADRGLTLADALDELVARAQKPQAKIEASPVALSFAQFCSLADLDQRAPLAVSIWNGLIKGGVVKGGFIRVDK